MADTIDRVSRHLGPASKGLIWEHNTHIGDARATDMAQDGMVNVGQLLRERHAGEGVLLVGFAAHRGSVIAADGWGRPERILTVPEARPGSHEDFLHQALGVPSVLEFGDDRTGPWLSTWLGHRAIGVVYHPERDAGNYVPTRMGERYDALIWLEHTVALRPVHHEGPPREPELGDGAHRILGRRISAGLRMSKAIVVGINGSAGSEAALAWALERAARDKLPVIVVHAVDDRWMAPDFQYHEIIRESGMELLQTSAGERQRSRPPTSTWTSSSATAAAGSVLREVSKEAALVVVGGHDKRWMDGGPLTDRALQVVSASESPVAVIPVKPADRGPGRGGRRRRFQGVAAGSRRRGSRG